MKGLNNMRKNSARKWLHFTLDLLPLIAIPVFMVYAHRHTLTERTNVEINYKYETNEVDSADDLIEGNIYHLYINNESVDNFVLDGGYINMRLVNVVDYNFTGVDITIDDIIYSTNEPNGSIKLDLIFSHYDCYFSTYLVANDYNEYLINLSIADLNNFLLDCDFVFYDGEDFNVSFYDDILITSSTYNEIESVNADTTNENILNVFYKDFTDTIDNYFNFDNVFTFGDIWQWFNTNMFVGNASPIAHAVYEIIVYEFIIDIMFLSYSVFMFIIDFTTDTLERFTGWSSRG